jgi:hypothetical protein
LPNNWRLRLPDFNSHQSDGELDSDHGADEDGSSQLQAYTFGKEE